MARSGILLAEEKIFHSVANTYINLGSRNIRQEVIYGTLLIIDKVEGCHIEWKPSTTDNIDEESGVNDGWAVVNADAVGYTNNKNIELAEVEDTHPDCVESGAIYSCSKTERFHNHIDFDISTLKSFRRLRKTVRQPAGLIFILDCGTTHHAIFFQKGGVGKFIEQLEKKAIVTQSTSERSLFLVSMHQTDALQTSFDALDLFADRGSALQRFATNPLRGTFSAFAKVSGLLTDVLVSADPGTKMAPEFCEELRTSIDESESNLPTVNSTMPEDPDYMFVDEKARLPDISPRQRERPLNRCTFESACDSEGRIRNPEEIKQIIYRGGITHELRRDLWKYLLSFYPWGSTLIEREDIRQYKVDEYFAMKLQWKSMTDDQISRFSEFKDRQSLIEKDVNRTDRATDYFRGENNEKLVILNEILMTYVMYNFDLGYVQGMSDLLSPILVVMDNEVDAFWCFVGFMDLVESNFELNQEGMKLQLNQLNQLIQIIDSKLYSYLDSQDSSNMYFAFRWLLILFKREFTMSDIMRLWEVFWTGLPCKNYQLVMAAALLSASKNIIMESKFSFTEILKHINDLSCQIDLTVLLVNSDVLARQLLYCENLPSYITKIIIEDDDSPHTSPHHTVLRSHSPQQEVRPKTAPPPRPATTPTRKAQA